MNEDQNLVVADVDCTIEIHLKNIFEIRGFPTLLLIKEEKVYSFQNDRNVDSFIQFVKEGYLKVSPSSIKPLPSF